MTDVESMDTEDLIAETLDRIRQRQGEAHKDAKRWQFRAESAEARVEELTTENARLEQEAQADDLRTSKLKQERDTLRTENERLEQEVAEVTEDYKAAVTSSGVAHGELRAHEGYIQWLEEQLAEERDAARTAVPRVISPDEVRKGQMLVVFIRGQWLTGEVSHADKTAVSFFRGNSMIFYSRISVLDTIVLLAEAPEDADEERPTCGCDCGCGATP